MHILFLKPKTEENQKDEHFNVTISWETS